jgi:hypothetical protein
MPVVTSESVAAEAPPIEEGAREDRPTRIPWRRLLSFAGLPAMAGLAPLPLIPVVTSAAGGQGWAAVALGQSLGAGAATVLGYGWAYTGPSRLWETAVDQRARLLWTSTLSRLLLATVLFPLTAVLAAALAPTGEGHLAALTALAFATFGLSGFWYYVALGRAGLAAKYETVPRLGALLLGGAAVLVSGQAVYYPLLLLAGQIAALAWMNVQIGAPSLSRAAWGAAFRELGKQRAAAGADVLAAAQHAVPSAVVALVAPSSLIAFASGERLLRLAQSAVQPVFNAFQGWVTEARGAHRRQRMTRAMHLAGAVALVAGVSFAITLPLVDHWLFAGQVSVHPAVSALLGAALALFTVTTSVSFFVFAPNGRSRAVVRSAVAGAAVGLAGLLTLSPLAGALGAAAALAAGQLVTLGRQVPVWRDVSSELRAQASPEFPQMAIREPQQIES